MCCSRGRLCVVFEVSCVLYLWLYVVIEVGFVVVKVGCVLCYKYFVFCTRGRLHIVLEVYCLLY